MWERLAPTGTVALWPLSEVGPPVHLGIAEARWQGLGPSLWSVQTDYNLAPGHLFPVIGLRESWYQSVGPLVGGEGRPGQASGTSSSPLSGGPALSRSQEEEQTVEAVSRYKRRQARIGTWVGC